jgi:probable phosphoglycerate mutase
MTYLNPWIELVLVRHGETDLAGGGMVDGQSDVPLTPTGEHEARLVAERLAREPIAAIFTTPLRRTTDTARPLATATGLTPSIVPDLREVHLGDLESRFAVIGGPVLMREIMRQDRWDIAPNAEPAAAFATRVARGFGAIVASLDAGQRAVAFVHGGVIAEACRVVTGSRALAFIPHLSTGSITRLRHHAGRTTLVTFNDTAHLGGAPQVA